MRTLQERRNDAVATASAIRRDLEQRLADCRTDAERSALMDSPEWRNGMDRAERAIDEADSLRDQERFTTPVPPAAIRRSASATEAPERREFNSFLRDAAQFGVNTAVSRHQDVLQAGVAEQGGFLAPIDTQNRILARLRSPLSVSGIVRQVPTSRDAVGWPKAKPASGNDASIYSSAFIGSWVSEIPAASAGEAEPGFTFVRIEVHKARSKCFVSRDWAADAEVDVLDFLETDGGGNLALLLESGIVAGDGNLKPHGVAANADITTVDVEGTTSNTISNTTGDLGSANKLLDLQYALPSQYHPNASFLMAPGTEKEIRKLIDGNGRFIWAAGFDDRPDTLLGKPANRTDFMPATGTDGNKVIVYGDFFNGYAMPIRTTLELQIDPFSKSDVEQLVMYLRLRAGGDVVNSDAFRIGIV